MRPNILEDPERAAQEIRAVVPESAGITDLFFDPETGEVLIEAEKPGVVIGKNGITLREITKQIGWTPKVVRTPPIESATVKQIRTYLRSVKDERKAFLRAIGRRIHREVTSKDQWLRVTTLGCCREVGRAAFLISTPESKILWTAAARSTASGTPIALRAGSTLDTLDGCPYSHTSRPLCSRPPPLKYGYEGPYPPPRDLSAMLSSTTSMLSGKRRMDPTPQTRKT